MSAQWLIEPRDPLVVRDARPNDGRSQSAGLPFPYPSSVVGVLRTRVGSEPDRGFVMHGRLDALLEVQMRGPLLADVAGGLFVRPPNDALVVPTDEGLRLMALRPLTEVDYWTDDNLPQGCQPVGLSADDPRPPKPTGQHPAFWSWEALRAWLVGDPEAARGLLSTGPRAQLTAEARLHVALGPDLTARDGMLFQTPGLRFLCRAGEDGPVGVADGTVSPGPLRALSLWLDVEVPAALERELRPGIGPVAGERRLARWSQTQAHPVPPVPQALYDAVAEPGCCLRVVLLSPAAFTAGCCPGDGSFLLHGAPDHPDPACPRIYAYHVHRPEVVSGWDLNTRGPRPTRRLAPAGSVYWVRLEGEDRDARRAFVERIWFQNISDELQARRDGFGLAVLGVVP